MLITVHNYFWTGPARDSPSLLRSILIDNCKMFWFVFQVSMNTNRNEWREPRAGPSQKKCVKFSRIWRFTYTIVGKWLSLPLKIPLWKASFCSQLGKIKRVFSKFLWLFLNKSLRFWQLIQISCPRYGGYDLMMGWDVKILGPFGKFLSCCYAVAAGASAGCAGIMN